MAMPMNLTEVAMPVGEVPHIIARFKHTAPEFGAFVVQALGQCRGRAGGQLFQFAEEAVDMRGR